MLKLLCGAGIMLFAYDNNTFILRSDLPYAENVTLELSDSVTKVTDIRRNAELSPNALNCLSLMLMPGKELILRIE